MKYGVCLSPILCTLGGYTPAAFPLDEVFALTNLPFGRNVNKDYSSHLFHVREEDPIGTIRMSFVYAYGVLTQLISTT